MTSASASIASAAPTKPVAAADLVVTTTVDAVRLDPTTKKKLLEVKTAYGSPNVSGIRAVTTRILDGNGAQVSETRSTSKTMNGSQTDPISANHSVLPASSGGCCSPSGEWALQVVATYTNPVGVVFFKWNEWMSFCWGGGTPGVHWGYVYNCGSTPGTGIPPYIPWAFFTNINGYFISSAHLNASQATYFAWGPMNYSPNTGYYDWQQGIATGCVFHFGCVRTYYPTATIWAHANGEYDYTVS